MQTKRSMARAFTLVEAVVVVIIIATVAAIVLVALASSVKGARLASERQEIRSLATAVEQFKSTFGFLPPLLDDRASAQGPIQGGVLAVRSDRFLAGEVQPNEPRYSVYSLAYFVMGLGDVPGAGGRPIDGAAGPRMTKPNPDGTFAQAGQMWEPFSAMGSKDATRLVRDMGEQARIVAVDRWGRGATFTGTTPPVNSLRYYRWRPQYLAAAAPGQPQVLDQYMVPRAVGDPNANPALRNAGFAIVSVGVDGLTDERRPLPREGTTNPATLSDPIGPETKDDIVEVGG